MNKLVLKDRNYTNGKLYKNLFELRFYKNYYLLNILPKKVKNYILIRYENLSKNPIETMMNIKNKFNLNMKENEIKNVKYYKKEKNKEYYKKYQIYQNLKNI
jgi:LPS sulfotransferase NodH